MNVHVLVSCRNLELWKFSTLVFDSIRVGFPTANIVVWDNHLVFNREVLLLDIVNKLGDNIRIEKDHVLHDEWINNLIEIEKEPFWIVDTDVVFFNNMENFNFGFHSIIDGIYCPRFRDQFTKYLTFQKLHTCVMRINPNRIKERAYKEEVFFAPSNIEPTITARRKLFNINNDRRTYIYHHDTMSELYHTLGGDKFTDEMKYCFGHINCGTYADLVDKKIPDYLARCHQLADNPELLRGSWKNDEEFYRLNPWPTGSGF